MKRRDLKPGDVFIAPEQRSGGRCMYGTRLTVTDQRTEVDEHGQKWAVGDAAPGVDVEVVGTAHDESQRAKAAALLLEQERNAPDADIRFAEERNGYIVSGDGVVLFVADESMVALRSRAKTVSDR